MRIKIIAACAILHSTAATAQTPPLAADAGFLATPLADCDTDLRYLNQVGGWQLGWPREWQVIAQGGDMNAALQRFAGAPGALADAEATLRAGIDADETAPRAVVLRVHQQVRDLTAAIADRDPRYFRGDDGAEWNALLTGDVLPALKSYEAFLREVYLPASRAEPGMSAWEGGAACFSDAVTWWTTLDLPSEEIEAIGARILEATRADLAATAPDGETIDDVMARLDEDQHTNDTTAEELIAVSEAALARADAAILSTFSERATTGIIVEEMPEHMHASFPPGFYRQPDATGNAAYVINPSRPGERRLMAEVIAFHEGAPGHHLFFAYPRDEEFSGYNAGLLEGWAIYAEYVADEMGLYSSTYDRQGMIAKHLWAASRLIVEPGLHLHGWSRDDAINFMAENTLLPRAEIEIEVDRYIAMPGQSLSYMLGADFLMTAREAARGELGDAFDIRAFHDVVLDPGVRSLPKVGADIRDWVETQTTSAD